MKGKTRVALYQMESVLGNCMANAQKIVARCEEVKNQADVLIAPELALSGWAGAYFKDEDFKRSLQKALHYILEESKTRFPQLSLVFGMPLDEDNAAVWVKEGKIQGNHYKKTAHADLVSPFLENSLYSMRVEEIEVAFASDFDPQNGRPRSSPLVLLGSRPFGNEVSFKYPVQNIALNSVGLALPYIFAGESLVKQNGEVLWQAPLFEEDCAIFNFDQEKGILKIESGAKTATPNNSFHRLWDALVFALQRFVRQNGFQKVALGLSGGLDSGLVLTLAVDALGKDKVHALILPSPYTSKESLEDAHQLLNNLNVASTTINITPLMESYEKVLQKPFETFPAPPNETTFENLQARIRAQLLMAYSNRTGALILNTSNKSECAVGYSTLYGDLIGGVAPIKDLYKTEIFELARWRNTLKEVIPLRMIEKAPSAELKPNQKDEDSLPPYAVLDEILKGIIENGWGVEVLKKKGFDEKTVREVFQLLRRAEYKRQQAPVGFLVSERGFDHAWHFPLGGFYGFYEQD